MKSHHTIIALACIVFSLFAQTDSTAPPPNDPNAWKISVNANLTLTLNTYSDNWDGGELISISWASQLDASAEKQLSKILNNKSRLKLNFGQTAVQEEDSGGTKLDIKKEDFKKSADLIDLESVFKFTLHAWVDPYVAARLISQFYDNRMPSNTRYFNPMEITESLGAARDIVKKEKVFWNARLGGAVRQSIDRDTLVVDTTTTTKRYETAFTNDGGLELVSEFNAVNKGDWLTFNSQLKLYEAFFSSIDDGGTDDWRYPDLNWENRLTVNITKYIMLNVYVQMLYDREIDNDPRLKSMTAVGLSYTFKNF